MIGRIRNSSARFESALDGYFKSCRDFRSKSRKGVVLVIDEKNEISDFLNFLVTHCNLILDVMHLRDMSQISFCIEQVGKKNIKAVIIDSHMLRTDDVASEFEQKYPKVPVFISNCEPDKVKVIKRTAKRVGVFSSQEPKATYVEALGLPPKCREMAVRYGS